jgi:hypothetical protein
MSIEPGRIVTIVRGGPTFLKTVALTGISYRKAAAKRSSGPGIAQLVFERRVPEIADETLGWEQLGNPIRMEPIVGHNGITTWLARGVQIPGGNHKLRLYIQQFEVLPSENRNDPVYGRRHGTSGHRLLFQDLIPL